MTVNDSDRAAAEALFRNLAKKNKLAAVFSLSVGDVAEHFARHREAAIAEFISRIDAETDNAAICSCDNDDYAHRYVECVEEEFARFTGDSTFGRAMRSKGFDDIANMLKEKKEVHEQGPIAKERRHIAGRFISLAGEMEESGCHAREIVERLKKLADQLTQEPSNENNRP